MTGVSQAQLDAIISRLTTPTPSTSTAPPRCRVAGCAEPLDPVLVDRPDNTGLHMMCEEPDPPSTVKYVRDILVRYGQDQPRSRQVALGPSELGTPCQRQIAYKLAGTAKRPITAPEWAPLQGTAMHTLMESALHWENQILGRERWIIEQRVHIDDEIAGNGDAFDTDHNMVVDWKYVGTTALDKLRAAKRAEKPPAEQVSPEYRVQAHLYGYGHERAGRTVTFVRLVLLARSWKYDDSDEWTEPYQPDIALAAVDRYYSTKDLLAALDPTVNPLLWGAVPAAPSQDACKWCPYQRIGGPADSTGCPGVVDAKVDRFTEGLIT
jgi:hypothetical protein